MIAHVRTSDGLPQPLDMHCRNVRLLCARAAKPLGLEAAAQLIGLLHDMGKATQVFLVYHQTALSSIPWNRTRTPSVGFPTAYAHGLHRLLLLQS